MLKFASNLSHLWRELPYLDRFDAAADAGFEGVEVLFPYDFPAGDTRRALLQSGLPIVQIGAPPPNYTGGTPGYAALPGGQVRFQSDLRRALRYAEALNVPMLHVMTGEAQGPEARATLVGNLRWAAGVLPDGVSLTLGPTNPEESPGGILKDYALTADVLDEIAAPNIGLQYDSCDAQTIHGDAVAVFEAHRALIRHIRIGDAPGRGLPGTGSVDFPRLFGAIRRSGYTGWISAAYTPGPRTEQALGWLAQARG